MYRSAPLATILLTTGLATISGTAIAHPSGAARGVQVCTLGSAAVGQPGAVICKDALTGAPTQTVSVGNTVVGSGGTGGTLSRRHDDVLVTNVAGGALLFEEIGGRLQHPIKLQTDGEGSLSGAIGERGAYVVTATRVLFYPRGHTTAASSAHLMIGDGSASQIALAGGYAYVAEKSGSLEAFALRWDGGLAGAAAPVAGIPAGVIVGITGLEDLVVSPVAHLATNANQATVPISSGEAKVQQVETKEVAACWAANDDGEVCITNPGSMTVSCGRFGAGGFTSYTSTAANPVGESVLDLDVRRGMVGILGVHNGARVLMVYARAEDTSDFLSSVGELSVGTAVATGALILPPLSR
jgi:hypothetical protein